MLAKLLCIVTVCNLYLGWEVELPRKDLILLESGEKVEGHIITITNGIIEIKTDGGKKRITRDVNLHSPRDIVEIGIIKKQTPRWNCRILCRPYQNNDIVRRY